MTAHYLTLLFAASSSKTKTGASSSLVIIYVVIIGAFGYVYMRSLNKRRNGMAQQNRLHQEISVGDEVLTGSGIFGIVEEILGDRVVLSTGDQSTVTVLRSTITKTITSHESTVGLDDLDFDHSSLEDLGSHPDGISSSEEGADQDVESSAAPGATPGEENSDDHPDSGGGPGSHGA